VATTITDDEMRALLTTAKDYTTMILKVGPNRSIPGVEAIIWEHGRRNMELRADGLLSIVCPVTDSSDVRGIGIFNVGLDETRKIMEDDPGVQAGVFVYEVHPCRSFPGDALPR
jgi:hypothetical protein